MAGRESSCLGQYNSSCKNRQLIQDMIEAAKTPQTLVVIIADECHWGAGAATRARARAGAGAGVGSCGTEEPDDAKGSGSERSAANHEVRAKICTSSILFVLAAGKRKWLLKYVSTSKCAFCCVPCL